MIAISSRSAVHASTRIRRNSARRSHGIAANIVRSKSTSVSTVASKPGCVRSTASPARAVSCLAQVQLGDGDRAQLADDRDVVPARGRRAAEDRDVVGGLEDDGRVVLGGEDRRAGAADRRVAVGASGAGTAEVAQRERPRQRHGQERGARVGFGRLQDGVAAAAEQRSAPLHRAPEVAGAHIRAATRVDVDVAGRARDEPSREPRLDDLVAAGGDRRCAAASAAAGGPRRRSWGWRTSAAPRSRATRRSPSAGRRARAARRAARPRWAAARPGSPAPSPRSRAPMPARPLPRRPPPRRRAPPRARRSPAADAAARR